MRAADAARQRRQDRASPAKSTGRAARGLCLFRCRRRRRRTAHSRAMRRPRSVTWCCSGPSHRVKMHGLALPSCDYFATPFGQVRINDAGRRHLRELGLAGIADAPHALEHSLEVQVPFLQSVLKDFDLLPIAVGLAPPEQVGRALEAVWGGPETLVVVSSDLSHHHTHVEAQALDQQTALRIVERRSDLSEVAGLRGRQHQWADGSRAPSRPRSATAGPPDLGRHRRGQPARRRLRQLRALRPRLKSNPRRGARRTDLHERPHRPTRR